MKVPDLITKRAVLFDMDGVLVRTDQLKAEAHSATVNRLGGDVPPSFYRFHMGNSHAVVRAAFLAEAGLHCDPDEYTKLYHEIYRHLLETSLRVAPGAPQLLRQLAQRGLVLAVVSSSRAWIVDRVLTQTDLHEFFQTRVSADDISRPKPAPDSYLLAIERLGVTRAAAVAVEDSEPGIEAAWAAGIPVLAIRHEFNQTHDFSRAVAEFPSLEDPAAILRAIDSLAVPVHA